MYRVVGHTGLAGVLAARAACSAEGVCGLERQKKWYGSLGRLLLPVSVTRSRWDRRFLEGRASKIEKDPVWILQEMKLNHEHSDPQTVLSLEIMALMEDESALLMAAAALCAFNGRGFVRRLRTALKGKVAWNKKDFGQCLEALLKQTSVKEIFTDSFDLRAYRSMRPRTLLTKRLLRVKRFQLPQGHSLRAKKNSTPISRKQLSCLAARTFGTLLGRNLVALLEMFFEQSSQSSHSFPTFRQQAGAVLGPGAVAGANILAGLPKGLSGGGKLIDIISGFETSKFHIKRLRRLLRVEAGRLRKLRGLKPGSASQSFGIIGEWY